MYFTIHETPKPSLPFYKTLLCLVCVLILIVNGVSLLHNLDSLKGANEEQSKTAQVSDKLQYVNVLAMDAESSLRGYFLSGSETYLGPMRSAPAEIDAQFRELKMLLADSPSQLEKLAQLRTLVNRRLGLLDQTLAAYHEGGLGEIVKIAAATDSKTTMDEIRLLTVIMKHEQSDLLASRSATFYREYQNAVLLGVGINGAAILVIVLFYRLIRRSFFSRQMAQRALQHANDNLESMVVLRTEQLSVLSRHLISVSEKEKSLLARELHDELGANLTAISMDIGSVSMHLQHAQPALSSMLDRARRTVIDTVELKRRIVENLRPSLLDHLGLASAVSNYCEEFAKVSGVACDALVDDAVDVADSMQSIALFRIVQEALNNIAKYARASNVIVHLACEDDVLTLEVIDDGIGIDSDAVSKPKSHGLLGMRERALLLGGSFRIRRGVNNVGTCVEASIPVRQPGATDSPPSNAVGPTPALSLETASASVSERIGIENGGQKLQQGLAPEATPGPALLRVFNAPRPSTDDHIPSLPPCSTHRHTPQGLDGPAP